jgi:hypothetical protein
MATLNQVRAALRNQPFRPFKVKLADGRTFFVPHPELCSMDPRGRELVIHDDEGMSLIEMGLVAEVRIPGLGQVAAVETPIGDNGDEPGSEGEGS